MSLIVLQGKSLLLYSKIFTNSNWPDFGDLSHHSIMFTRLVNGDLAKGDLRRMLI